MKKDKDKKGIAPDEVGELPNELRCKQCFGLMSKYEDAKGNQSLWCFRCGTGAKR